MPIYNASATLPRALDSAIGQTLAELEIICINDGSTDNSLQIIQEYQARDARIKLLDKPNTGYGDSMNQGIKLATGEYLAILEPDDCLAPEALANMYRLATSTQADIVKCNHFRESAMHSAPTHEIRQELSLVPSPKNYAYLYALAPDIWAALYRREFVAQHHLEFLPTPGAAFQDLGFNFKTLALAQRVTLSPAAYLHYQTDNEQSSVHDQRKVNCVVEEYAAIQDFLKQHNLLDVLGPAMAAAKFRNYYWNWQRLTGESAHDFFCTMRCELLEARQRGWIQRRYFALRHWLALQLILRWPKAAERVSQRRVN